MRLLHTIIALQFWRIAFICLGLLVPVTSFTQKIDDRARVVYFELRANAGSPYGLGLGAGVAFKKRHEISLGWDGYLRKSDNYPADFECHSCKHGLSKETLSGFILSYGYVLYPGILPGNLRIILQGGVLIGSQNMPRDFVRVANPGQNQENYTYNNDARSAVAFVLTPTLEVAVTKHFAVAVGPYGVFSDHINGFGISMRCRVGEIAKGALKDAVKQKRAAAGISEPVRSLKE